MSLLRNVNTRSVEDMYGLLGRSPSEAEFQLFLSQGGGINAHDLSHAPLHDADGQLRSPDAAGLVQARSGSVNNVLSRIGSIPRVASLDFWRDIVLKGTTSFANLATVGSGLSAYNAATSLSAGEPAVEVKAAADNGVMPPPATRGRRSSVKAAEAEEAAGGWRNSSTRPSTRNSPASSVAAMASASKSKRVVESPSVSDDDSDDDPAATQRAMDAELLDENGKPKSLSKEEMRRVRRMISNRESARRSRRRKLEHVQCLDGQIQAMARENHALLSRLQASEQRAHDAGVDNTRLKEELESLKAQLCNNVINKPLTRVTSQEHLAKRGRAYLGGTVPLSAPPLLYDPAGHAVPHYINPSFYSR